MSGPKQRLDQSSISLAQETQTTAAISQVSGKADARFHKLRTSRGMRCIVFKSAWTRTGTFAGATLCNHDARIGAIYESKHSIRKGKQEHLSLSFPKVEQQHTPTGTTTTLTGSRLELVGNTKLAPWWINCSMTSKSTCCFAANTSGVSWF